ncbi:hypothetical protein JW964_27140 [candidate division KSB1 bacterium]|nr:hypothetical protein [candidate division KSB1 bacterium]
MENLISHSFNDESIEAKTRWFQSLSLAERMQVFCEFMELVLEINPSLLEKKDAQPIPGRVQVLKKT